jgi:uncharacterized membrane protein YfcA
VRGAEVNERQRRRAVAGLALFLVVIGSANHLLGLGLFGNHSKQVMALCYLAGILLVAFYGPRVQDMGKTDADNE